jgi:hypothetical protein
MDPLILVVGRMAMAEQLVGALGTDPVIESVEPRPAPRRTRRWVAVALRAAADRLAPVEPAARPLAAGR